MRILLLPQMQLLWFGYIYCLVATSWLSPLSSHYNQCCVCLIFTSEPNAYLISGLIVFCIFLVDLRLVIKFSQYNLSPSLSPFPSYYGKGNCM